MQNNYNVKTRQTKTYQPKYIGDKKVDEVTGDTYGVLNKISAAFNSFKERAESLFKEMLTRIIQHTHDGTDSVAITGIIGVLTPVHGGTGVANNNLSLIAITGNFPLTITLTAGTSVTFPTSGTLIANPMSAVGDIIHGGAGGVPARLVIGTANTVLKSDGTDTAWNSLMGLAALDVPLPANGRLIYYNPVSGVCEWLNTSAELRGVMDDETGSGVLVFGTNPTLSIPIVDVVHFTPQGAHPAAVAGKAIEYFRSGDNDYKYVRFANGDIRRIALGYMSENAWRLGESYTTGDVVQFGGSDYTNIRPTDTELPTNTTYWALGNISYFIGLVSWWKGENNADDAIGSNNGSLWAGSAPPLPYGAGQVGTAFWFPNPGLPQLNWVTVPNDASLNVTQISIEAWINRTGVWSAYDPIIKKKNYSLEFNGNLLSLWLLIGGVWKQSASYAVSLGVLYHVIATYDGTTILLYINGVAYGAPVNAPGSIDVDATTTLEIGKDPSQITRYFWGMEDEVSLWNRALTAAEALAIYNKGTAGK